MSRSLQPVAFCMAYCPLNVVLYTWVIVHVGGWQDGYVNCVFRMASVLPNVRGVVGPWGHDWADIAKPGTEKLLLVKTHFITFENIKTI